MKSDHREGGSSGVHGQAKGWSNQLIRTKAATGPAQPGQEQNVTETINDSKPLIQVLTVLGML